MDWAPRRNHRLLAKSDKLAVSLLSDFEVNPKHVLAQIAASVIGCRSAVARYPRWQRDGVRASDEHRKRSDEPNRSSRSDR